jgi:hypothetical protein
VVGQQPDAFQLGRVEHVGFVDDQHDAAAAFGRFGGERVSGLRDERGVVEPGDAAERGDDGVVDAARPDLGVGQVDDRVAGRVQAGQGGADGDSLASADLAGEHPEGVLADQPADPGDCFGLAGVPVQLAGGQVAAERHLGEPVERGQLVDAHRCSPPSACSPGSSWLRSA